MNKSNLVRELTDRLPINEMGLPDGLYRPDLLPDTEDKSESKDKNALILAGEDAETDMDICGVEPKVLSTAYVKLDYIDGYPAISGGDGSPIWTQLDFEPIHVYTMFDVYLNQSPRSLSAVADTFERYSNLEVNELASLYYWRIRARAFDLYRAAHNRHLRANRIMQSDNDYYAQSVQLANIAEAYITSEDFSDLLTPKTALETLRLSHQIAQASLHIKDGAPNGNGKGGGGGIDAGGLDISVELRRMAGDSNQSRSAGSSTNTPVTISSESDGMLDELLADEVTAEAAQELILRVNTKRPQ